MFNIGQKWGKGAYVFHKHISIFIYCTEHFVCFEMLNEPYHSITNATVLTDLYQMEYCKNLIMKVNNKKEEITVTESTTQVIRMLINLIRCWASQRRCHIAFVC